MLRRLHLRLYLFVVWLRKGGTCVYVCVGRGGGGRACMCVCVCVKGCVHIHVCMFVYECVYIHECARYLTLSYFLCFTFVDDLYRLPYNAYRITYTVLSTPYDVYVRWVMSGTPTTGSQSSEALQQLQVTSLPLLCYALPFCSVLFWSLHFTLLFLPPLIFHSLSISFFLYSVLCSVVFSPAFTAMFCSTLLTLIMHLFSMSVAAYTSFSQRLFS